MPDACMNGCGACRHGRGKVRQHSPPTCAKSASVTVNSAHRVGPKERRVGEATLWVVAIAVLTVTVSMLILTRHRPGLPQSSEATASDGPPQVLPATRPSATATVPARRPVLRKEEAQYPYPHVLMFFSPEYDGMNVAVVGVPFDLHQNWMAFTAFALGSGCTFVVRFTPGGAHPPFVRNECFRVYGIARAARSGQAGPPRGRLVSSTTACT